MLRRLKLSTRAIVSISGKDPYLTFTRSEWTLPESGKADLQFRRQQSFSVSAKILEAVGQTGVPVFLVVRLLGSCVPVIDFLAVAVS